MKIRILSLLYIGMMVFSACSKDDPQDDNIRLSEDSFEVKYGESHPLAAEFRRDGYTPGQFTWSSSHPNIAAVDRNGVVTGEKAGEAVITVQTPDQLFSSTSKATVVPTNFLFMEPLTEFRQSRDYIRNNETRKLLEEDEEFMYYEGEDRNTRLVAYYFNGASYEEAIVVLGTTEEIITKAVEFLFQRYDFLVEQDEIYVFNNRKNYVFLFIHPEMGLTLVYLDDDNQGSQSAKLKQAMKALDTINPGFAQPAPANFKIDPKLFK
jgi:hypothetical protein